MWRKLTKIQKKPYEDKFETQNKENTDKTNYDTAYTTPDQESALQFGEIDD